MSSFVFLDFHYKMRAFTAHVKLWVVITLWHLVNLGEVICYSFKHIDVVPVLDSPFEHPSLSQEAALELPKRAPLRLLDTLTRLWKFD